MSVLLSQAAHLKYVEDAVAIACFEAAVDMPELDGSAAKSFADGLSAGREVIEVD